MSLVGFKNECICNYLLIKDLLLKVLLTIVLFIYYCGVSSLIFLVYFNKGMIYMLSNIVQLSAYRELFFAGPQ